MFRFLLVQSSGEMDEVKLCYACLAPKNVCTTCHCKFEAKALKTLKCQGCAPWALSENLAPFNILFCRPKDLSKL